MSTGDFHCHSSRSDGTRSPSQVVDLAAARGVRVLALTDHDTLDGLPEAREAASRHAGMMLIPGVELSCDVPGTEVHMLGLFVDEANERFQSALARMRTARLDRAERIVGALSDLGAPIEWARVQEIAGDASIGRPHIARALVEAGHVDSFNAAFDSYLARNSPAYVERMRLEPAEAIELITDAGGLAVFAHPPFTEGYESIAAELAEAGLFGMEVYYRAFPPEQVASLHTLAEQLGLVSLGGSDYHGLERPDEREPGDIPLPDEAVDTVLAAARARGCAVPA